MSEKFTARSYLLGLQHFLAMFGATVLVPFLTGMDTSLAILAAGCGTLIFHGLTKGIVPVFVGSSFAFIGAISVNLANEGLAAVKGGIMVAGLVYIVFAGIIYLWGLDKVKRAFPPIVIGPIIILIGLRLSPVALQMAGYTGASFDVKSIVVALSVVLTMLVVSVVKRSFFNQISILLGIVVGYTLALILGLVDLSTVASARWIGFSSESWGKLTLMPQFSLNVIISIAPISLVVFMEHIGDMTTNGATVGKNFLEKPGLHRTLLGDGFATMFAGLIGGPANTTYGENTGVLAITKVYDPRILRLAALYAIAISFVGKIGAIIQSIPVPVMGGVSIILFGMIAAIGIRNLVEAELDFGHSRNLLLVSITLVLGIAISSVDIAGFQVSGLTIASVVAILLNQFMPRNI